jgi:hypothetical protein
VKCRLDHVYRRTVGRKGEFLIYTETLIGETLSGNRRFLTRNEMGKYDKPIFEQIYDQATGKPEPTVKVSRFETVYEIPYSPENVQNLLAKDEFDSEIGLTLDLGHIRYSIRNREGFINLSTPELMQKVEQYY